MSADVTDGGAADPAAEEPGLVRELRRMVVLQRRAALDRRRRRRRRPGRPLTA